MIDEGTPQRRRMPSMHEGFDSQNVTPSKKVSVSLVEEEDIDDPDNVLGGQELANNGNFWKSNQDILRIIDIGVDAKDKCVLLYNLLLGFSLDVFICVGLDESGKLQRTVLERRWPGPIGNPKLNQDFKESVVADQTEPSGIDDLIQ